MYYVKDVMWIPVLPTTGIQRAKRIDKLGMRSSDTAQIFFEDVRVPQSFRIGEEGQGFTYQMMQFQEERLWGAAGSEAIPRTYIYRVCLLWRNDGFFIVIIHCNRKDNIGCQRKL